MRIRRFWLGDPESPVSSGWEIVSGQDEIRAMLPGADGSERRLLIGPPVEVDIVDLAMLQALTPYEAVFRVEEGPWGVGESFSPRQYIERFAPRASEAFTALIGLDDELLDAGLVRQI